jgi:hypothetical protein
VAEQQFTKRSVSIGVEKAKELSKTEKRERTSQKGFATPGGKRRTVQNVRNVVAGPGTYDMFNTLELKTL